MPILSGVALACSLAGIGPIVLLHGSAGLRLEVLQVYLATVTLLVLPLAAELEARRRLLDRVRTAEELQRLLLEGSSDVVLRLGVDAGVRYVSPAAAVLWGMGPERLIGRTYFELVHHDDVAALIRAREQAFAHPHETTVIEYRLAHQSGGSLWVESHIRATLDRHGKVSGTVSIVREVTKRRELVEDLARRATTDPLTGLANRRAFDEAMADCSSGAGGVQCSCVAIFDLDHFKRINDNYGHAAGDAVLACFAEVLRSSVRDGDLAARLGGEEFGVLLVGATVEQARLVCERIRKRIALADIKSNAGEAIRVTVSAGMAALAVDGAIDATMVAADTALYKAKHAGRNRLALAA